MCTLPPAGVPWEEGVRRTGSDGETPGDGPEELLSPIRRIEFSEPELSDDDTLCAASFNRAMTPRADTRAGMALRGFPLCPLEMEALASPEVDDTVRGVGASDAEPALSKWDAILARGRSHSYRGQRRYGN